MLGQVAIMSLLTLFFFCRFRFRYKNETVAVKIVHQGETTEEIAKREARFAREVAMLSRVQHKNLVKVGLWSKAQSSSSLLSLFFCVMLVHT